MLFLDSNVIIAYKNKDDSNHARASDIFIDIRNGKYGTLIISEFVFHEVVTILALRHNLRSAVETGEILLNSKEVEIVKASDIFQQTWEIFKNQTKTGTKLSFVDASNLACLRFLGFKQIATFDKDFRKYKDIKIID